MRIVMRFQYTEKLQDKEKIEKENAKKHCNKERVDIFIT